MWDSDEEVGEEMEKVKGIYGQGNEGTCWNSGHLRKWTTTELSSHQSCILYMTLVFMHGDVCICIESQMWYYTDSIIISPLLFQ